MIKIKQLCTQEDIFNAIQQCANSMFDQRVNDERRLFDLSTKFANYAQVAAAYKEDKLAGYVAFYCNNLETKTAFISIIVVKKEYQGCGIGSQLYSSVIQTLRDKSFTHLNLEVAKLNTSAINFYEDKGFIKIEERDTSYIFSKPID